jgi:hypothetical protein
MKKKSGIRSAKKELFPSAAFSKPLVKSKAFGVK